MSYWDKIANAKALSGGNIIRDGVYRFIIERLSMNTDGYDGASFIAEFRVVEAAPNEPGVEPNPVGSTVSFIAMVDKHKSALGNVKAFLLAALGMDDSSGSQFAQICETVCGKGQPMRGVEVRCTTYRKINQGRLNPANAGKQMTLCRFDHVPGQSDNGNARIKANRAMLDGGLPEQAPAPAQSSFLDSLK